MKKFLTALILGCFSQAHAAGIGFDQITESEFKDIVSEMSSAWVHTSVSPASSLGHLFGFEIGLIAGASKTDTIAEIAKRGDPTAEADTIPHAGILGVVTFPYGISGEINFLPEVKNSDLEFSTGSLGIKWTMTEIWPLPVDMALKLHSGSSKLKWNQDIATIPTDVSYEQTVSGLLFQVSKKFLFVEPYLSLGSVRSKGKLAAPVAGLFDSTYTNGTSAEEEIAGSQFLLGINLNLGIFRLGLETGKSLGATTASLKASLYF